MVAGGARSGAESWPVSALHDGSTYCVLRVCADADAHAWWLAVRRRRNVPSAISVLLAGRAASRCLLRRPSVRSSGRHVSRGGPTPSRSRSASTTDTDCCFRARPRTAALALADVRPSAMLTRLMDERTHTTMDLLTIAKNVADRVVSPGCQIRPVCPMRPERPALWTEWTEWKIWMLPRAVSPLRARGVGAPCAVLAAFGRASGMAREEGRYSCVASVLGSGVVEPASTRHGGNPYILTS
jgi:hypothetical protein